MWCRHEACGVRTVGGGTRWVGEDSGWGKAGCLGLAPPSKLAALSGPIAHCPPQAPEDPGAATPPTFPSTPTEGVLGGLHVCTRGPGLSPRHTGCQVPGEWVSG